MSAIKPARKSIIVKSYRKPQYITAKDLAAYKPPEPQVRTYGRFTVDNENFHGRLAMASLVACATVEHFQRVGINEQVQKITHVSPSTVGAVIAATTIVFILQSINPKAMGSYENEVRVFDKPGFTQETEILHGRIAMMVFAYAVIAEVYAHHLVFL